MALWGNKDSVYADGTVAVNYSALTVTGTGATFDTAGISVGDVIRIGAGSTYGEAVIAQVSSASTLSIASTQFLSGSTISGASYSINQQPKYALGVGATYRGTSSASSLIYGVDSTEVGTASTTAFAVTHSGWVAVGSTYIDSDGNLRVKHEVLVAGGIDIATDGSDDNLFKDATITITSQPASVGVGTTETATFSVVATAYPDYAPLTYQWYEDDGGGFDPISGATGTSVSIANTDSSKNGYEYYVNVTSGTVTVQSGIATMTVS